jgi:hypothetical protein
VAAGLGLLGFSFHGMATLDETLREAAAAPAPTEQVVEQAAPASRRSGDCPFRDGKQPAAAPTGLPT